MKKLFLMAVIMLSSVSIFAQSRVGTTTIQPKIGLNVSSVGDGDWKAGCVFGAELQHQFNAKAAIAGDFSIPSKELNMMNILGIQDI